jgi:hypothetical protein
MLDQHFTDTVTISRRAVAGYKTSFTEVGTLRCHIQPIGGGELQAGIAERLAQGFRLFSATGLQVGDKLEDQGGMKYEVVSTVSYKFRIGRRHHEATLRGV